MRHVLIVALALSLAAPVSSAFAAGDGGALATASITGSVRGAAARAADNTTVRLRNVANGQVAGTTTTNAAGQFAFAGLEAGNYVVEFVNAAGAVVATSTPVALAAGAAATGVSVSAADTVAAAGTPFFSSLMGILTVAAAGAAVVGVTVAATRPAASSAR